MGFPFFVSLADGASPQLSQNQAEGTSLYVKHVEVTETKPCFASYKKVENSLLVHYLVSTRGLEVLEQLMVVTFSSNDKNFIIETLKKGIECNGSQYYYLGQSSSQLRHSTCYVMNASLTDLHSLLEKFEDFNDIFPVAKRSQKISLLFSPFQRSLELKPGEYDVIDDVTSILGTYVFTDGCGLMSCTLSQDVQNLCNLPCAPSVIEVKFKGFRGTLVRFNDMPNLKVKALFRNSMLDFSSHQNVMSDWNTIGIVGFSQPYSLGYLDTLTMMLLAEGGVSHEYLEALQGNYHDLLERLEDKTYAGYFLRITGKDELLQTLEQEGLSHSVVRELQNLKIKEIENMKHCKIVSENEEQGDNYQLQEKNCKVPEMGGPLCDVTTTDTLVEDPSATSDEVQDFRILIPDSRVVYGVSDPYGQLKHGECFFQPTLHEAEQNGFSFSEFVLVIRRPSYHAGDVRVLKITQGKEAYKDLYDCIVFPTRGARPHANECAGGRVGGDKYFVSWDQGLIPLFVSSPYMGHITSTSSKIVRKLSEVANSLVCLKRKPVSDTEARKKQHEAHQALVKHFSHFREYENLRQKASELFVKYASLFGSTCTECELLKETLLRDFGWSDCYDQVKKQLRQLEEAYEIEIQGLTNRSRSTPLPSSSRGLDTFDRLLISLQWKKPPFLPGDDVWNKMKAKSATFVASQIS